MTPQVAVEVRYCPYCLGLCEATVDTHGECGCCCQWVPEMTGEAVQRGRAIAWARFLHEALNAHRH